MTDYSGKPSNNLKEELTTSDWVNLLTALDDWWFAEGNGGNELLIKADELNIWQEFRADDWLRILLQHPRFALQFEQYALKGFLAFFRWFDDSNGWVQLLSKQPQLSNYCDKVDDWRHFSDDEWQSLLVEQPQFAWKCSKYDGWTLFDLKHWLTLLRRQPQFKEMFVLYAGWDKLSARQWMLLLQDAPVFSDICGQFLGWDKLDGFDWVVLLRKRPEFTDKCDKFEGWQKINECGRWPELLSLQPQFAVKCDEFDGWEAFDGFDWWQLLRYEPLFASKCNAHNGWYKIKSFKPKWVDDSKYYFDSYGDACVTCTPIPEKLKYFDYESQNFVIPEDYDHVFSRNAKLKSLINFGLYAEYDAFGNPLIIGSDFRASKPYYKTIKTTLSYGDTFDNREIGGLPIDLYGDVFWMYNPVWARTIDTCYWLYVLCQHLNDGSLFDSSGALKYLSDESRLLFQMYNKRDIWQRFSKENWELILSPHSYSLSYDRNTHSQEKHYVAAKKLNRAAINAGKQFWDAIFAVWPECIYDVNCLAENESENTSYEEAEFFTGWSQLLRIKPELTFMCENSNGWRHINTGSWKDLLDPKWHFFEKVQCRTLGVNFWKELLKAIPANSYICDKYEGWKLFRGDDWLDLVAARQQFVNKLVEKEGWRNFTKDNWLDILVQNGLLAEKVMPHVDWSIFSKSDWLCLIEKQEQFVEVLVEKGLLLSLGWYSKHEVLKEIQQRQREWEQERRLHESIRYIDEEVPDWREESGWNDVYGNADPSDFIEFR